MNTLLLGHLDDLPSQRSVPLRKTAFVEWTLVRYLSHEVMADLLVPFLEDLDEYLTSRSVSLHDLPRTDAQAQPLFEVTCRTMRRWRTSSWYKDHLSRKQRDINNLGLLRASFMNAYCAGLPGCEGVADRRLIFQRWSKRLPRTPRPGHVPSPVSSHNPAPNPPTETPPWRRPPWTLEQLRQKHRQTCLRENRDISDEAFEEEVQFLYEMLTDSR